MIKRCAGIQLCMVLALAMIAGAAQGQEKTTHFGLKGGFLTGGEITVDGVGTADSDASFSVGGFVDYEVSPKLLATLSLDMHNLKAMDESKMLLDISAGFKVVIKNENSKVAFRPNVTLGYGSLGSISEFIESSTYLMVKGGVEAVFASGSNMSWLGEVSIMAAPTGGNADFEASYGPVFLIRGGVLF